MYISSAPVFVCRKKKIDFSNGEPEKKFLTVLRAIEVLTLNIQLLLNTHNKYY